MGGLGNTCMGMGQVHVANLERCFIHMLSTDPAEHWHIPRTSCHLNDPMSCHPTTLQQLRFAMQRYCGCRVQVMCEWKKWKWVACLRGPQQTEQAFRSRQNRARRRSSQAGSTGAHLHQPVTMQLCATTTTCPGHEQPTPLSLFQSEMKHMQPMSLTGAQI